MAGRGFIHDKLEIKFLILYIAARVIEPIPFETVLDLTMCDDAIDYFDFSECLSELVKTDHLTLSEEGLYAITERGRALFRQELSRLKLCVLDGDREGDGL